MSDTEEQVSTEDRAASVTKKAFDCPWCGAYTAQTWYELFAKKRNIEGKPSLPFIPKGPPQGGFTESPEAEKWWYEYLEKYSPGKVFLSKRTDSVYGDCADNINLSMCYICNEIAVWVYDKLIFPSSRSGPNPNPDLPNNIKIDYEEARSILDLSPRGAAALLRLCIQKLCIHLGVGDNLNEAIKTLKVKGLKQKIVDALDIVRVIGNESVHPGEINLNDDRDTAVALFGLVNLIVEEMISEDKHIDALYSKLPASKRQAIADRDKQS